MSQEIHKILAFYKCYGAISATDDERYHIVNDYTALNYMNGKTV